MAMSKSEQHFDAVLALVEGGMTLSAACASRTDFPKMSALQMWVRRRIDLKERLSAALKANETRWRSAPRPRAFGQKLKRWTSADLDAALAAIRNSSDRDLRDLLKPPLPSYSTLLRHARQDEAFNARFRAAIDARDNPWLLPSDAYDDALDAIARHPEKSVRKIIAQSNLRLPSYDMLNCRARTDPEFGSRFHAVMAAKYEHLGKRVRGVRFSAESYAQAIEIIKSSPNRPISALLHRDSALPSRQALRLRAQRDEEFAAQLSIVKRRRKKGPKPVYREFELKRLLRANDLYRSAAGAARSIDPDDRDDIRSDIIVGLLEGSVSSDNIRSAGARLSKEHRKQFSRTQHISLDEAAWDDDARTSRLDLLTTCEMIY